MNIQSVAPQAVGYTPRQMTGAFNQTMAQAHQEADPRRAMKTFDKAGMSRGAGQQYLAGTVAAQSLADGVQRAYSQSLQDQAANAGIALGNDVATESMGLGVGGIAQQQRYANALAALQRQQQAQGALGGLLGGNLDSFLGF